MKKTLFQKRREYVNREFGNLTRETHTTIRQKKKILLRLWKEAKKQFRK